jgi:hypothetical protein
MLLRMRHRHSFTNAPRGSIHDGSVPVEVRFTKVHEACESKDSLASLGTLQHLVRSDSSSLLSLSEDNGWLPLHMLLMHPQDFKEIKLLEMVTWLVQHYPLSVEMPCGDPSTQRWMPLHVACANRAPRTILQYLIRQNPKLVQVPDAKGNLPLHLYVKCPHETLSQDVLEYLIQKYPGAMQRSNKQGQTVLHCMLLNEHDASDDVKEIQRNPAYKNMRSWLRTILPESSSALLKRDLGQGQIPLHYACRFFGHTSAVLVALVQANPDALGWKDHIGRLPLHILMEQPFVPPLDSVQALIELFPESLQYYDDKGRLPIHIFLEHHFSATALNIVEYLVSKAPSTLAMPTKSDQQLTLHLACQHSKVALSVVQHLLEANPKCLSHKNAHGETPLQVAKEGNVDWRVMQYLYKSIGGKK